MPERSVYLLESGLPDGLPGVSARVVGASFPFWGTRALFDFAFASLRGLSTDPCWLVCDTRDRQHAAQAALRWGRGAVRQRDSEDGLAELRKLATSERAPWVVVSSLSYAALLEPDALPHGAEIGAEGRFRADGKLLPVYLLRRETLLDAVEQTMRQPEGGLRNLVGSHLSARVQEQIDVPGKALFVDNLMELWEAHHSLRVSLGSGRADRFLGRLEGAQQPSAEARIGTTGAVKDSLIGPGAQIDGTVEDSFVFPGVTVRRGAEIRQSVVMNGARIGADSRMANTLVLPWPQELGGEAESIGAGSEIGELRNASHVHNEDSPRQISRGLTVVGMGCSVPPAMVVEAGCCLGPNAASVLRGMKKLARGATVR
jgi:hypothetical protein